jgi:polysaccharide export outer membrane protein
MALKPRRASLLPFASILLVSGCFLPHPVELADSADYEAPPVIAKAAAVRAPAIAVPPPAAALVPAAVPAPAPVRAPAIAVSPPAAPAPATHPAVVEHDEAGIVAAMQRVVRERIDYRLAPADLVSITVYKAPDMNRKVRLDSYGTVPLTLLGPVKIGGMTLTEAQARIEGKLAKFLINPQISLSIEQYGNKTIFVMGEVQNPGSYPIPADSSMTVPEAIRTAGGFTPAAAQDRARLLRYVDGANVTFTNTKDVVLEPNDIIIVPQNAF